MCRGDWRAHHPSMKSIERLAAALSDFELEIGTNQCDIKVIPIFPFCKVCIIFDIDYVLKVLMVNTDKTSR